MSQRVTFTLIEGRARPEIGGEQTSVCFLETSDQLTLLLLEHLYVSEDLSVMLNVVASVEMVRTP